MRIAITGTPCTGKTSIARALSKKLGYDYVNLNEVAEKNDFFTGYDRKRKVKIVDVEKLKRWVKERDNIVMDAHYSHEMDASTTFLIRTDIKILRKRMEKKGWPERKIKENIECEIFNVVKEECYGKSFYEVYNNSSVSDAVKDILWLLKVLRLKIKRDVLLTESIKEELRKPYGNVIDEPWEAAAERVNKLGKGNFIYTVGDPTSYNLIKHGVQPAWIIYDGKEKRRTFKKRIKFPAPKALVKNKRGMLSKELFDFIKENVRRVERLRVYVKGEEDIAVLPLLLFAHANSLVLYGFFDRLVCASVDEKTRRKALKLFKSILASNDAL